MTDSHGRGAEQNRMNTATILVVDDEPQLRRADASHADRSGLYRDRGRTGEEALEMLRHETAELVLLDLNMPGIGGLETCRAIRETSDVPIIVLSVRNTERDKVEVLDAGADDYVTKPYGIQELLARIRAAMRRMPAADDTNERLCQRRPGDRFRHPAGDGRRTSVRLTPERIRSAAVPGESCQTGPFRTANCCRQCGGPDYGDEVGIFAGHGEPVAQEDRTGALQTEVSADRALGWLPVCHAGPAESAG